MFLSQCHSGLQNSHVLPLVSALVVGRGCLFFAENLFHDLLQPPLLINPLSPPRMMLSTTSLKKQIPSSPIPDASDIPIRKMGSSRNPTSKANSYQPDLHNNVLRDTTEQTNGKAKKQIPSITSRTYTISRINDLQPVHRDAC